MRTGTGASVPVLSLRRADERAEAARLLAAGATAAFYLGLFTIVRLVRPPWREARPAAFATVKPARPPWSKLPMVAAPRHSVRLVDAATVHPAFRHLVRREAWEGVWSSVGAPLHVIAPVRRPARFLPPSIVTDPADLEAQAVGDRLLPVATAAFFWFDDPCWRDLADTVARRAPRRSFLAGTSFNASGEQPPYTLEELDAALAARADLPVDVVVHDEVIEAAGVFGSHTMVRLPLGHEPPALVVTRDGSVGAEWITEATGFAVLRLGSTATASRRDGFDAAAIERNARALAGSSR
jgi:hypothetical protein